MRGKNLARLEMPPVLGLPPAIQKILSKLESALAALSALVAFESLTNRTFPKFVGLRPTCCMRWARPGKITSPFWMVGRSTLSATQAATGVAAFCALCARSEERRVG